MAAEQLTFPCQVGEGRPTSIARKLCRMIEDCLPDRSLSATIAGLVANQRMPRPSQVEFVLTAQCNLRCAYCFERVDNAVASMSLETATRAIVLLLSEWSKKELAVVTFLGGEPMLRFNVIREVITFAAQQASSSGRRICYDMTTNGLLLEEEHVRYFREVGLRYCLSLDGDPTHNDRHRKARGGGSQYAAIAAKMRMLKRYQHWQGARVTVMPDTAAQLAENVTHLHRELAINQFIIGFATSVPWSDAQIADYARGLMETFEFYLAERLAKLNRRLRISILDVGPISEAYLASGGCGFGCGAGSGRVSVAPDGTLHGCTKLAFAAVRKDEYRLGTVEMGLNRPENRRKLLDHSVESRPKCRACEIAAFCNGGCYAANLADTGDIYSPADYYCKLMFAQKTAADYARRRLAALGVQTLRCERELAGDFAGSKPSQTAEACR